MTVHKKVITLHFETSYLHLCFNLTSCRVGIWKTRGYIEQVFLALLDCVTRGHGICPSFLIVKCKRQSGHSVHFRFSATLYLEKKKKKGWSCSKMDGILGLWRSYSLYSGYLRQLSFKLSLRLFGAFLIFDNLMYPKPLVVELNGWKYFCSR